MEALCVSGKTIEDSMGAWKELVIYPDVTYFIVKKILSLDNVSFLDHLKPYLPKFINIKTFKSIGRDEVNYLLRPEIYNMVHNYDFCQFDLTWSSSHGESLVVYKDVNENPGEALDLKKGEQLLLVVSEYKKDMLHVFIFNEKKELKAIGWIRQSNNLQLCLNTDKIDVYNKKNGTIKDTIKLINNQSVEFIRAKDNWIKIRYYSKDKECKGWISLL